MFKQVFIANKLTTRRIMRLEGRTLCGCWFGVLFGLEGSIGCSIAAAKYLETHCADELCNQQKKLADAEFIVMSSLPRIGCALVCAFMRHLD